MMIDVANLDMSQVPPVEDDEWEYKSSLTPFNDLKKKAHMHQPLTLKSS